MNKVQYDEDSIFNIPDSGHIHEYYQSLREELDRMERERDYAYSLLRELAEYEDENELEDIVVKVRSFIETVPYPTLF